MKGLSGLKKKFFLEMLAVPVVFLFIASSVAPIMGNSHNNAISKNKPESNFNPFTINDNSTSNVAYVKYTLSLLNGTLINGNFFNTNGNAPVWIAFDSSNGYIYVTNSGSNSVSVINGATDSVITSIPVGSEPYGVTFDSSNGYIYVTNYGSNSVSVINGATDGVVTSIPVGSEPAGITFDSSNGYIYVANYNSGTISIISTEVGVNAEYPVTFTETSLPSGTAWYVNITGGASHSSTTSTITFNEPNGTYSYTVATGDKKYVPNPVSGTFTVNWQNLTERIMFYLYGITLYKVTFTERGLPNGTTWYTNITNGTSYSSTTGIITFTEPNGTYNYTVNYAASTRYVGWYYPTPRNGSFIVKGTNVNISVIFNLIRACCVGPRTSYILPLIIVVIIVVVAVVVALLMVNRKKRRGTARVMQPVPGQQMQMPVQQNPYQQQVMSNTGTGQWQPPTPPQPPQQPIQPPKTQ